MAILRGPAQLPAQRELTTTAISASIAANAVDVFVYDTRKDSDGGAWRKRCQHTSWYNETLNTATRGSRREFPAVAVIVTTATDVIIYDGDDPDLPMWMTFNEGGTWNGDITTSTFNMLSGGTKTSTVMMNGLMAHGELGNLITVNFISERSVYRGSQFNTDGVYRGNISQRNSASGHREEPNLGFIVNANVNDVAITVLPNAPIDASTGLPTPTVIAATSGGVSLVNYDSTVSSVVHSYGSSLRVSVRGNELVAVHNGSSSGQNAEVIKLPSLLAYDDVAAPIHGDNDFGPLERYYGYGSLLTPENSTTPQLTHDFGWNTAHKATFTQDELVFGSGSETSGVIRIAEVPTAASQGLQCVIKKNHNSGWMPAGTRGAWLSDNTVETVSGVELVTDGGFETAANWTLIQGNATITRSATGARNGSWGIVATSSGGSDVYSGREITGLQIGKTYTFSVDYNNLNHATGIQLHTNWANSGGGISYVGSNSIPAFNGWRTLTTTFTATTTSVWLNIFAQGTIYLDNLSLRTGEADRSPNRKGLQVFGSITKSALNTGTDLVAYSGFSASNYLEQPNNHLIDFGTGDFCVMGWINGTQTIYGHVISFVNPGVDNQTTNGTFHIKVGNDNLCYALAGGTSIGTSRNTSTGWLHFCAVRRNGFISVYFDGQYNNGASYTQSITGKKVRVGYSGSADVPNEVYQGRVALLRVGTGAPTADQILKIYNDERHLFQPGAQACLFGTSDAITALAYDDATALLHVGTSSGRSTFDGLRRVENTTTAVTTAISASNGLVAEQ